MSNNAKYKDGLELLFTETIHGYRLHAMEHYPYAVKTKDAIDQIVVEVCQINIPKIEKAIHDLELSVGYYYDEAMIRGRQTGIYLFHLAGPEALVAGGDWVNYFRN